MSSETHAPAGADPTQTQTQTFDDLGLSADTLRAVKESGYNTPTPIQAQAIPDNHPSVVELNRVFGDHTFFLDESVACASLTSPVSEIKVLDGWGNSLTIASALVACRPIASRQHQRTR